MDVRTRKAEAKVGLPTIFNLGGMRCPEGEGPKRLYSSRRGGRPHFTRCAMRKKRRGVEAVVETSTGALPWRSLEALRRVLPSETRVESASQEELLG